MPNIPLTQDLLPLNHAGSADLVLGDRVWHCNLADYHIHGTPPGVVWDGVIVTDALLPADTQLTYYILFDNGASGEIHVMGIATTGQLRKLPFTGLGDLVMSAKKPKSRKRKVRPPSK